MDLHYDNENCHQKQGRILDKNWIPTSQAEITIGEKKKKNEAEGDSVR